MSRGEQQPSPMTEHCHLLGTAGTGAHLGMGTAMGTGTRHKILWLPRTPLPAVTPQDNDGETLGEGHWHGGSQSVTEGGWPWLLGGHMRSTLHPFGPASSPLAAYGMALRFQIKGKASKPQHQTLRAVLGSRAGSLSHSLPRQPPQGKLRYAHGISTDGWRHKRDGSLHSAALGHDVPNHTTPLSPCLHQHEASTRQPQPRIVILAVFQPQQDGCILPARLPPRGAPGSAGGSWPPEHGADVGLTDEFGFSSWGVLFFPCWFPFSTLTPWPRGLG